VYTQLSRAARIACALAFVAGAPLALRAQGTVPPAPASSAPRPRRTVEIRAQAPAPEVITVRPREVPQYTRRLLAPALLSIPDTTSAARGASVVAPAPASAEARALSTPDTRKRTP
jgi:hypothetical protein